MDNMKSSVKVYKILLSIVHAVFAFIYVLCNAWAYLRKKITNCCHEVVGNNFKCLDNRFKGLSKVPQHLAIILGPEKPSFKDLVNIVIWCTASGITFISFYDHKGILKKTEEEFFNTIKQVSGLSLSNGFWTKHEAPFNGYKNGFIRRIHIKVLSLEDGQHSIVEATKHLINSKSVNSKNLKIEDIDNYLSERLGRMPDPDLAVYCGETCATYGFLPWQVRVTEFVNLKSHHNVTIDDFVSLLQFYCHCEQRYGK